jgi:hypothetical protein
VTLFGAAVRDGVVRNQPSPVSEQGAGGVGILIVSVMMVAFFFLVAAINNRAARKLQTEIDALDRE